jgi:mono/diheme cytochrome c family protein
MAHPGSRLVGGRRSPRRLFPVVALAALAACAAGVASLDRAAPEPNEPDVAAQEPSREQIERGRLGVLSHACGGCHGGGDNPQAEGWLAGLTSPEQEFRIGACAMDPDATPCFLTRPRNLTPDNTTGVGRFSERQIFNALRFGLRPGETPDVEITSTVAGEGNFPENPKYLAPPMPWPAWRHMTDQELWDIAAYLKHGVKPVENKVEDSEGPPDFWASAYTVEAIGPWPAVDFPTENEVAPEG